MVRQSAANTIQLGDIYLLGTVLSGAFGYTLSGRLSRTRPGWEVISWQVASFLPLSIIAAYIFWPASLAGVPASAWAGLTYVSFVSQFFAFFVFNAAMAMAGGARRSIDVAAALRNRRPVGPGERRTFRLSTLLYAAAVVAVVDRPAHAGRAPLARVKHRRRQPERRPKCSHKNHGHAHERTAAAHSAYGENISPVMPCRT
jgi:drug/metabolite transporter (DMT)-like permease